MTRRGNDADIAAAVRRQIAITKKQFRIALLRTLRFAGEECLNAIRNANKPHHYRDHTGCLRSSTGYIVTENGRIVYQSNFTTVGDGSEGSSIGKAYALEVAKNHPQGWALILIAGEHYAEYVERRGWDVLVSGKLRAERVVPQLLQQLAKEVQNMGR